MSSNLPQIQPNELADDAVILDVREQDEWDLGHAPGAIHIPLGELPARLAELPARLAELPDTDGGTMAITCRGGGRSSRAVAWLSQQGFDVANLDGGMIAWSLAGKQLVAEGDAAPRVK